MKILCLDIGNTRAHYGLVALGDKPRRRSARGGRGRRVPPRRPPVAIEVLEEGSVSTASIGSTSAGLPAIVRSMAFEGHLVEGFAVASVVPAATEKLRAFLESERRPVYQVGPENCPGLEVNFPRPGEIGQDRLALALGAQSWYGAPTVVIDMGTAVTFDILGATGAYEGGIIAPGLAVMTRYLHEQTALLPELDPEQLVVSQGIGKSTVEAMQLGCVVGFAGMIRALLERVRRELRETGAPAPKVVCTGGAAASLPLDWLGRAHFDEDLLLRGLAEGFRRSRRCG
jgi:type III pantothenate kinase